MFNISHFCVPVLTILNRSIKCLKQCNWLQYAVPVWYEMEWDEVSSQHQYRSGIREWCATRRQKREQHVEFYEDGAAEGCCILELHHRCTATTLDVGQYIRRHCSTEMLSATIKRFDWGHLETVSQFQKHENWGIFIKNVCLCSLCKKKKRYLNGLHVYNAFLAVLTTQGTLDYYHIRTFIQWWIIRGNFWVQYLSHGLFSMRTGGAENWTVNLPVGDDPL